MASVATPEASPAGLLRSLRGRITAARLAYPDVLHVEIRDSNGDLWRLATQDADWSPSDPAELTSKSVESANLDEQTGELKLGLSGGSSLRVIPAPQEADDDPANWKLLTPDGLVLILGPGGQWHVAWANERSSVPIRRETSERQAFAPGAGELASVLAIEQELSQQLLKELPIAQATRLRIEIAVGASIASAVVATVALIISLR